jgi:transcriptional regulator with XRE-family HTH domain
LNPTGLRPVTQAGIKTNGGKPKMVLLRCELGEVLRSARLRQQRTLRDVSQAARVSLGYLSEVERGHKEASSELLASICEALDMPLWETLRLVADRMAASDSSEKPAPNIRDQRNLTLVH